MRSLYVIARSELGRLLATRRGLISLIAFALIWAFILLYAIVPVTRWLEQSTDSGLAELVLEPLGLRGLGGWSSPQLAVFWLVGLYLLPSFAILIAADQTASDQARGTLRFQALRVSRGALFLGRFVGQLSIQFGLIVLTAGSVVIVLAVQAPDTLASAPRDLFVIVVNLLLTVFPWIALMALCSTLARSPRQATLYALIIWIVMSLILGQVRVRLGSLPSLEHVMPGSEVSLLRGMSGMETFTLAAAPLLQGCILLVLGWAFFRMRDL